MNCSGFQVPESVMGESVSSLGATGQSETHMDAFGRNIQSYQEQIGFVLMSQLYDMVLLNAGKVDVDYKIVWGKQNDEEKNAEREKAVSAIEAYCE